tara:strand:- start:622 stop:861 length:240 start_codon:yes stop_codon:yes gene_type:complete
MNEQGHFQMPVQNQKGFIKIKNGQPVMMTNQTSSMPQLNLAKIGPTPAFGSKVETNRHSIQDNQYSKTSIVNNKKPALY